MKIIFCRALVLFLISILSESVLAVVLPYPILESAQIEWWPKPAWKETLTEYQLHVTLFSFTVLDISTNRFMLNQAIERFIANYDKAFNNWISSQAPYAQRMGQTLGLNLLAKMNILPNSFIIQENSNKLYQEMIAYNSPTNEMPWYLIVPVTTANFLSFNAWIKNYFNKCWLEVIGEKSKASLKFRDQVKLKQTGELVNITSLPHLTLGKVTSIKQPNRFYEIINKLNKNFMNNYNKSFPIGLNQLKFIDGPAMKTLQGTTIINKSLMLYIPWDLEAAIAIKKLVTDLPKVEQKVIEDLRLCLYILTCRLASLENRKHQLI